MQMVKIEEQGIDSGLKAVPEWIFEKPAPKKKVLRSWVWFAGTMAVVLLLVILEAKVY